MNTTAAPAQPRDGYDLSPAALAHFHNLAINGYKARLIKIATTRNETVGGRMEVSCPERLALLAEDLGLDAAKVLWTLS